MPWFALYTGFDIESLIFSFGIGGIGAVLYDILAAMFPLPCPQFNGTLRVISCTMWQSQYLFSPFLY